MTLIGLLVLAGCGGSGPDGGTTQVATLGDSITAGSPGYDPDPRMRETLGIGADEKSQWQYWTEQAEPRLRFRNCGVYGQRTDEIARRLDECARDAQVLIVQGGINDIVQGRPVERAADNLRRMVERGKELVGRVALAERCPFRDPREDSPVTRPIPALARLDRDSVVGNRRICSYVYLSRTYVRSLPRTRVCPLTPNLSD